MPVYEYACEACGKRFEQFLRSVNHSASPVCPHCGGTRVHKSISLFGVVGGSSASPIATGPDCGPGPV